jgi:hypothetical protein
MASRKASRPASGVTGRQPRGFVLGRNGPEANLKNLLLQLPLDTAELAVKNRAAAPDSAVVALIALKCGAPLDVVRHGVASSPLGVALDNIAGDGGAR